MKDFFLFFALQFVTYGVFCWNARAIANAWYGNLAVSDLLLAWLGFTVMEKIGERKKNRTGKLGYVLGGAVGSLISVFITKHVLG